MLFIKRGNNTVLDKRHMWTCPECHNENTSTVTKNNKCINCNSVLYYDISLILDTLKHRVYFYKGIQNGKYKNCVSNAE